MSGTATKKPRKARKPKPLGYEPLPDGTVLLRCSIEQRAVPWSAPTVGKGRAFKNPKLVAWQEAVKLFATENRVLREPYEGPVEVNLVCRFAKGPIGDASNLLKAAEDSLQGVVFVNDRQVVRNSCERSIEGYDLVLIEVRAASPVVIGEEAWAGAKEGRG